MNSVLLLCSLIWAVSPARAEPGLVLQYAFSEGQGNVVRDLSGLGNEGKIQGATWVPSGSGYVLRLDGKHDQVDCGRSPTLNPAPAVSAEVWLYPEAVPNGIAGIVGNHFGGYLLGYNREGRVWWFVAGGDNKCGTDVAPGSWYHLVGTFDGKMLRLYRNGVQVEMTPSKRPSMPPGGTVLLGTSSGSKRYTRDARLQGMLGEVRVYDRALSAEEVARHYRAPRGNGQIEIHPRLMVHQKRIEAEIDLRALGEPARGAVVALELFGQGAASPIAANRATFVSGEPMVELAVDSPQLTAGKYRLSATATRGGKSLGKPGRVEIQWPQPLGWKEAPQARVLNSLVAELLAVSTKKPAPGGYRFTNPREGWVLVAATAMPGSPAVPVKLDGQEILQAGPGTGEAMRLLGKGSHEVWAGPGLERIVVRAVPELVFANLGSTPHVPQFGPHDMELFGRHVLPNVNVLVVHPRKDLEPLLSAWKAGGKRLLMECPVPSLRDEKAISADEAEKFWSAQQGLNRALIDGVIVDEFWASLEAEKFAAFTAAARRIHDNPKFAGRVFCPYCGPMYSPEPARKFMQAVFDLGWPFALERYLPEQRTPRDARAKIEGELASVIEAWQQAMPGAREKMIVCLGTFSQPYCSLDCNPAVNYKTFLDMQFHHLANDPRCFGLRGVMTYTSSYMDPETIRWVGRLLRHYCIEGGLQPLASDPLVLGHLQNPEFEQGLAGWTVAAAGPGSVATRTRKGLSWLEGRWPVTSQGDTVLWMKRAAGRPNVVSQVLRGLQPGRVYLARMFSGDWNDPRQKQKLGVSLAIEGGEVLRDRAFQHVFTQAESRPEPKAWLNYHGLLFRAARAEATLKISDWASPTAPGGPAGQELMVNFVEVRPSDEAP